MVFDFLLFFSGKLFYLDPDAGGTGCHCRPDWSVYHWPETGECFEQESPGPCPPGQYFAYNSTAGRAACACFKNFVPDPSAGPGQPACVELHTAAGCPAGQVVTAGGPGGAALCECGPHLQDHYWPADGRCYPHYARGPCREGEQFRLHPTRGRPACILWGRTSPSGGY